MIIDCISDLHGEYPQLEGGDLLIVAGDLTNDSLGQVKRFKNWIIENSYLYKKIVAIAGNHDNWMQNGLFFNRDKECWKNPKFYYLEDSGTEFALYPKLEEMEEGKVYERPKFKIYGSPWTLRFKGMNPACMAFTVNTEEELAEKWALIPDDTDILVTHSPIFDMRDVVEDYPSGFMRSCGSKSLRDRLIKLRNVKLHVFGHIHGAYGKSQVLTTTFVNASHLNEQYEPVNKPIRIVL